jgi:hypothetical protein
MAGKSRQVIRAYVLDTSYLLEIYRVPGRSDEAGYRAIKPRLRSAIKADARLYLEWIEDFERDYAAQGLGLSDLAVTKQANSLASRHPHLAVHIWTTDHSLKAQEPQAEPDAFVGA